MNSFYGFEICVSQYSLGFMYLNFLYRIIISRCNPSCLYFNSCRFILESNVFSLTLVSRCVFCQNAFHHFPIPGVQFSQESLGQSQGGFLEILFLGVGLDNKNNIVFTTCISIFSNSWCFVITRIYNYKNVFWNSLLVLKYCLSLACFEI